MILPKYRYFDTPTGGRLAGWMAGRVDGEKQDIKANSAELKLELGLSLAKVK